MRKADPALMHAILVEVDKRQGPIFNLVLDGFRQSTTWNCARWLIDQRMLHGEYGLSDIGEVKYLIVHALTPKGRTILRQLEPQFGIPNTPVPGTG